MRIFVSYASERRAQADRIAVGLRQTGAQVFFDRDALPAGAGYDAEIRSQIRKSHLFLFLVSPESLEPGTYALTELAFARDRWPDPSGHVLPVAVAPLRPGQEVPPYLAAVGILSPAGNAAAEVQAAVAELQRRRRGRWIAFGAAVLVAAAAAAAASGAILRSQWPWSDGGSPRKRPCALEAEIRLAVAGPVVTGGAWPTHFVVTGPAGSESFAFGESGHASFDVAARPGESWTIDLYEHGTAFGRASFTGCPSAPTDRKVGNVDRYELVLTVQPRPRNP